MFLVYYQRPLHLVELAWFPVVVLVQLIFTLGCALLLSALTVHFRDVRDILGHLMTFWFFATPIIYPYFQMEAWQMRILNLNPFTHLAITYQEILYFEGSGRPLEVAARRRRARPSCSSCSAISCSTGCAIRLRRRSR